MTEARSISTKRSHSPLTVLVWLGAGVAGLFLAMIGRWALQTAPGIALSQMLRVLFATDSTQLMWYITRAAGLTSYVLLWLSVAWGLAVSSKILDNLLHRSFTYDFHQFISLLSIGFVALHIGILLFDRYLPYSVLEVLVPFLSPYRPVWVGIGSIGFYLALLVTVTYYVRGRIGMKAFRTIHYLSLLSYLGVTVHGLFAGTDSSLVSVLGLYAGSLLVTVFLTSYWVFLAVQKSRMKKASAPSVTPKARAVTTHS